MLIVKGFKGIRYNPDRIKDFTRVVAPPYDVIDSKQQDGFYAKDPHNVIRLILAKGEGEERYSSARKTFNDWMENEILVRDESPCIYPYYQEFEFEGQKYKRKGFIATVKIEDFDNKAVLPHEQTFRKHKEDRLRLTEACRANLSQVFCVYSDKEGKAEDMIDSSLGEPQVVVDDGDGVRNSFWRLSDPEILSRITDLFRDKTLLIADGHHRYETAINYRNLRRQQEGGTAGDKPYDYVMMYLSRGEGEGLIINPTHRVVRNLGSINSTELKKRIGEYFDIEEIGIDHSGELEFNQLALLTEESDRLLRLTPKKRSEKGYMNMAVMVLHNVIFGDIIDESQAGILYTKFSEELVDLVKNGDYKAGFILPKLSADQIFDVVLDGTKMPHKTTYFYPKILSGLVFNPLW